MLKHFNKKWKRERQKDCNNERKITASSFNLQFCNEISRGGSQFFKKEIEKPPKFSNTLWLKTRKHTDGKIRKGRKRQRDKLNFILITYEWSRSQLQTIFSTKHFMRLLFIDFKIGQ